MTVYKKINYTFKKSRRVRHLRATVYCDGRVVVTAPLWTPDFAINFFLQSKKFWIENKVEYFKRLGLGKKKELSFRLVCGRINNIVWRRGDWWKKRF